MMIINGLLYQGLCCCVRERKCFSSGGSQYSDTISLSQIPMAEKEAGAIRNVRNENVFNVGPNSEQFREEKMMAVWWGVTYNQYGTSLMTRNRRLNLPDTLLQVTLGPCQGRICHGKMDVVCLPSECSDITPTGSVLNPWVLSNLDWGWTLASKCSGPAAHCSGSHRKSRGIGQAAPGI